MPENPLAGIRKQTTVDLAERATFLRDELLPELAERIAAAEDADDPPDAPAELRDLRDRLAGQAGACERVTDALGGGEFTVQELMTKETALLTDDVTAQSVDVDYEREEVSGTPKQGYHKVRTLELSLVDAPDAMPSKRDRDLGREVYAVGDLPDLVTDHLFEIATQLNDAEEVDGVGNSLSFYGVTTSAD